MTRNISPGRELVAELEACVETHFNHDTKEHAFQNQNSFDSNSRFSVSTKKEPISPVNQSSNESIQSGQSIQQNHLSTPKTFNHFHHPHNTHTHLNGKENAFPNNIRPPSNHQTAKCEDAFKERSIYEMGSDFKSFPPPIKHAISSMTPDLNPLFADSKITYGLFLLF